jgi:hydrophobic/amphiphilic exporter-1 (mainly G- bacteria), HAE1 family
VVLENSYRYVQNGYEPEESALKGTTEVASAITSSTLTTIAVFLPLALVGGIVSKFFVPLSLTVALALVASLIVAVTIIPVLVSIFLRRRTGDRVPQRTDEDSSEDPENGSSRRAGMRNGGFVRFLTGVILFLLASALAVASGAGVLDEVPGLPSGFVERVDGFVSGIGPGSPVLLAVVVALLVVGLVLIVVRASRRSGSESDGLLLRLHTPMLRWSLRDRLAVLLLALLTFAGGLGLVRFLPVTFFPPSEERLLIADVELPAGTALGRTSEKLRPFEDFLQEDAGIKSYQVSIGGEDTQDPESPSDLATKPRPSST